MDRVSGKNSIIPEFDDVTCDSLVVGDGLESRFFTRSAIVTSRDDDVWLPWLLISSPYFSRLSCLYLGDGVPSDESAVFDKRFISFLVFGEE